MSSRSSVVSRRFGDNNAKYQITFYTQVTMFGWEGVCEFVSVAEQGALPRPRASSGVSVAQVSRQVAQLEDRLQAKLLLRTTRQVRPTELGRSISPLPPVAGQPLRGGAGGGTPSGGAPGLLAHHGPVSYGESRIAPLVNDFMVRFPQLEVTLNLTNQLLDLVHEGSIWRSAPATSRFDSWWPASWRSGYPHVCPSPAYTARHGMPNSLGAGPSHLPGGQRGRMALHPER